MTTFTVRSVAIGTLVILIGAGTAAAQSTSPILNTLEVQKLVASGEPADHAKLSAHFAALSDRNAAEAKRHEAMAKSFVGNPNRNAGGGMSAHCRKLADLNNQSAVTLRELATYHQKLAGGTPAAPPRDAARFEGGAGASKPTGQELNALAAKVSTPAEHRALAEYFQTLAKRYTADAEAHVAIARSYRGTRIAQAADHCDRIVANARESAKEATAAAEMHLQFATIAR
jgi:hypothetical protein